MFCIACGHSIESAARFCVRCGQAISARAESAQSAYERGVLAMQAGRHATAVELFRQALAEGDDRLPALLMLAYVHWLGDDLLAAEECLRQVIALAPGHAHAHALLGSVLLAQLKVELARDELDMALRLAPDDFRVRVKRAEYFFRLGCYPEVVDELGQALRTPAPSAELRAYARDLLREAQHRAHRGFARQPLPFISINRSR